MSDPLERLSRGDVSVIDAERLQRVVTDQRWFAHRVEEPISVEPFTAAVVRDREPALISVLVEARFPSGATDAYQLLVTVGPETEGELALAELGPNLVARDALDHPDALIPLVSLIAEGAERAGIDGRITFQHPASGGPPPQPAHARRLDAEHSNSAAVLDDDVLVKAYRRLWPGPNPELELLTFLASRDVPSVPALLGSWSVAGSRFDATLGIVQRYLDRAEDGWEIALDEAGSGEVEPAFLGRIRRLGVVTAELHVALASDDQHPDFCPERAGPERLALLIANLDERVASLATDPAYDDDPDLRAAAAALRGFLRVRGRSRDLGYTIRGHGDYHLGQTLWWRDDWHVVDFEGEPLRDPAERRRKRSPLRDVAGALRSIDYAAACARLTGHGAPHPEWAARARAELLDGYLSVVPANRLIPAARGTVDDLLLLFELEKALYELDYERAHRPDWVHVPSAGIVALVARAT
ncbi:MAG: hypothetical protein HYX33_04130 [Actinobacteria bacterium]|nr:hypothetical protein [Actinomycetota bacterium]